MEAHGCIYQKFVQKYYKFLICGSCSKIGLIWDMLYIRGMHTITQAHTRIHARTDCSSKNGEKPIYPCPVGAFKKMSRVVTYRMVRNDFFVNHSKPHLSESVCYTHLYGQMYIGTCPAKCCVRDSSVSSQMYGTEC